FSNNPETLQALSWLGVVYLDEGRLQDAFKTQTSALSRCRSILGNTHIITLSTTGRLADTANQLKMTSLATRHAEKALKLFHASKQPFHPEADALLYNAGLMLSQNGALNDAGKLLREAL